MLSLLLAAHAGTWNLHHQVAVSLFPEGLRYSFTGEYRIPLWNSDSILFSDTFFAPGLYADVTPAYFHIGPHFEWDPIAVLEIDGQADFGYYFGTFSGVTDFVRSDSAFDPDAVDAVKAAGHSTGGISFRGGLTGILQAKVSHLILAFPQEFFWFDKLRPAGTPCTGTETDADSARTCVGDYWYESQYDTLMKWNDLVMTNSGLAFWAFREKTDQDPRMFWLGVNFSHQYTFGTGDRTVKVGPMAVFRPGVKPAVPTVVVFTQVYLDSRIHDTFPPYLAAALVWNQKLTPKSLHKTAEALTP
jgi:hypothetical protein